MSSGLIFDIPPELEAASKGWFPVCRSHELKKEPIRRFMFGKPVVLFRSQGAAAALIDYCPHRGVALSEGHIKGNTLRCCYHGWSFASSGRCIGIPGLDDFTAHPSRDALAIPVFEGCGMIWCCPSPVPDTEAPVVPPHMGERGFYSFIWNGSARGRLIDIAENFLDGAHTHFVHKGLIRRDSERQRIHADVRVEQRKVEVTYTGEKNQSGLISQWLEGERVCSFGRFLWPCTAELEYRSTHGVSIIITSYISPTISGEAQVYAVITFPGSRLTGILKRLLITPFFRKALRQDRKVLARQADQRACFPDMPFCSTRLDLVRFHIMGILEGRQAPKETTVHHHELNF